MSTSADATVLHVEDDADNRQSLAWLLRAEGFHVVEADSGADALRVARRQPPDLVLLDVGLPDMSGFEVCHRLKTDPDTSSIPVLQLSGYFVEPADRVQGLETGADAYLMKPVEPRELIAHMRALLRVHRAERAARAAARQWQTTFDAVGDGICVLAPDGGVLRCNRAMAAILGQAVAQVVGHDFAALLHSVDPAAPAAWLAAPPGGEPIELPLGGRWYRVRVDAASHDAGAVDKTLVWDDFTARKQAEEELRRSEERLRAILETTADAVLVLADDGTVRDGNPATTRLFGFAPAQLTGRPVTDLLPPPGPEGGIDLGAWLRSGQERLGAGPATARRRDGATFPAELSAAAMHVEPGRLFAVFVRDLTDRNRLEDQLRQAVKMEAVGRLAGGIAHDFNNQLTVINGYADLLLSRLAADDPGREALDEIRRSGEHAATLTRQLLAFSRKQILAPQVLKLNDILGELARMLRRLLGDDIELLLDLDPDLGSVWADAGQVEQVLVNLAVNARDAMPEGGRLMIRTYAVDLDAPPAELAPGPYVVLEVRDSGLGMSEEVKARIFEPFFTTKGVGKGTGLGLAMVYGIVKQSGGHIDVESAPGRGTTFRILLPRTAAPPAVPTPTPAAPAVPRGTETILLVEDEPGVRALAAMMLRSCGYTVFEASDGSEAERLSESHGGRIDLLVSDVMMPRTTGPQLAERLQSRWPRLRVLFISGYSDDALNDRNGVPVKADLLNKPFTPAQLADRVRQALDRPRG